MKLIICAGERLKDGWVTHDIQDLPNIDYVCDFWKLAEHIEANSVEEMEFTHALEHFPIKDSTKVLKYLYDLLEDGGKLYIEVPNFLWHAEEILVDPTNRQIVEYAFGGQLNPYDYHYNGYTPQILAEDLRAVGFTVESLQPNSSIECRAVK